MRQATIQKIKDEIARLPFDLEDVEKFTQYHESWQNGTKIKAYIKDNRTFEILGKDFPKFRKLVLEAIQKEQIKEKTVGFNGGTPAAFSYQARWRELSGNDIKKLIEGENK